MRRRRSQRRLSERTTLDLVDEYTMVSILVMQTEDPPDEWFVVLGRIRWELSRRHLIEDHGPDCACEECFATWPEAPSAGWVGGPF